LGWVTGLVPKFGSRTGNAQDCPYRCRNPAFLDESCVGAVHPGVPWADPRAWESHPITRPSYFGLSAAPTPSMPALTGSGASRLPSSIATPLSGVSPSRGFPGSSPRARFRGRTRSDVSPAHPVRLTLFRGPPPRARPLIPPCPLHPSSDGRTLNLLSRSLTSLFLQGRHSSSLGH